MLIVAFENSDTDVNAKENKFIYKKSIPPDKINPKTSNIVLYPTDQRFRRFCLKKEQ